MDTKGRSCMIITSASYRVKYKFDRKIKCFFFLSAQDQQNICFIIMAI